VEDVLEMTRTTYKGPLLIGEDLTAFVIDKGDVKVIEPPKK
jgi:hypothetical protein